MLIKDGYIAPGRIHTLFFSNKPLNDRRYRKLGSLHVDLNLKDVSLSMASLISETFKYASLGRDNVVEGRSWEMGAVLCLHGVDAIATGIVESFEKSNKGLIIHFGPVPGTKVKEKMTIDLLTNEEIPRLVSLP